MLYICYPKCTTCKKAQKWLDDNNISYEIRDIKENNPTFDELSEWHRKSGLLYKSMGLKDKLLSMSEKEQLELLSTDGMLVKRPIVVTDDTVLVGFKESEWEKLK